MQQIYLQMMVYGETRFIFMLMILSSLILKLW